MELLNFSSNASSATIVHNHFPTNLLAFAAGYTVFIMLLGIVGNCLTIVAIIKIPRLRNAATAYIVSLSIADLLLCIFNLPLSTSLFLNRKWIHSQAFCVLMPFLRYLNVGVSLLSIAAITLNRYMFIIHRNKYDVIYRPFVTNASIIGLWTLSLAVILPTTFGKWGKFDYDARILSCTIVEVDGRSAKTFLFMLGFLLPCLSIIVCYTRILCVIHRSNHKIRRHSTIHGNSERQHKLQEEWRLARMVLIIFISFIVCYLPVTLVKIIDKKGEHPTFQVITSLLVFTSACINPIIYAASNRNYRQSYLSILSCISLEHTWGITDIETSGFKTIELMPLPLNSKLQNRRESQETILMM